MGDAMRSNGKPPLLTRRPGPPARRAAGGTIAFLPALRAAAAPEPGAGRIRLTAGSRILDVNGKPAPVFGLFSPNGKPGITVAPGERFNVDLVNRAGTSTIINSHAQLPPWNE